MEIAIVLDIWGFKFSSDALISRVTALIGGDKKDEAISIKILYSREHVFAGTALRVFPTFLEAPGFSFG